jgi:tetratricopeptide (TPR) repeat protein
VDRREGWQALQSRLTAARVAADRGDRDAALAEVSAALELDPDFLAAHSLRERLLAADPETSSAPASSAAASAAPARGVSADSYAKFQDRAKRKRLDGRTAAARAAIARGRLRDAAAALDEVIVLDPLLPELASLTADFDALRRRVESPRRGRWVAAAGAFAATVLAASWLQDSAPLVSRPMTTAGLVVPAAAPSDEPAPESSAVATTGASITTDLTVDVRPAPTSAIGMLIPSAAVPVPPPPAPLDPLVPPPTPIAIPQAQAQIQSPQPQQAIDVAASPAMIAPVAERVDQPDDSALVQQALQRYRRAYEGLDARSAQAVWPAVNEAALARAFDGLESQTLTFDGCEVHMFIATATAICQGSARYVPKVGSREPRVEPRTWSFRLRKDGGDWKIDSARVEP